jgi:L-seryl-tRNA(Ser) seleniumtransferase
MIATPAEALKQRAHQWTAQLHEWGLCAEVIEGQSTIGGGSLPGETMPTSLLAISAPSGKSEVSQVNAPQGARSSSPLDALAARLRAGDPPLVARILRDRLLLDPRTVLPEQDATLLDALRTALTDRPPV